MMCRSFNAVKISLAVSLIAALGWIGSRFRCQGLCIFWIGIGPINSPASKMKVRSPLSSYSCKFKMPFETSVLVVYFGIPAKVLSVLIELKIFKYDVKAFSIFVSNDVASFWGTSFKRFSPWSIEMRGVVKEPSNSTMSWGAPAASLSSMHIIIDLANIPVWSLCEIVSTSERW